MQFPFAGRNFSYNRINVEFCLLSRMKYRHKGFESVNIGVGMRWAGRAVASLGYGPPWYKYSTNIHGTNIVDRGLKVLFSAFFGIFWYFFRCSLLWKRLNSAILYFLLIFGIFFPLPPLENFLPTPLSVNAHK